MAFILFQTLKILNCPEPPCTGYFSSFRKEIVSSVKKSRNYIRTCPQTIHVIYMWLMLHHMLGNHVRVGENPSFVVLLLIKSVL